MMKAQLWTESLLTGDAMVEEKRVLLDALVEGHGGMNLRHAKAVAGVFAGLRDLLLGTLEPEQRAAYDAMGDPTMVVEDGVIKVSGDVELWPEASLWRDWHGGKRFYVLAPGETLVEGPDGKLHCERAERLDRLGAYNHAQACDQ